VRNPLAKNWLGILLLSIVPVVLVACAQAGTIKHEIQLRNADGASVSDATVRAEIGTRDFVETVSNAAGLAHLTFDEKYVDRWAKVIIEAEGYERKSILVKLLREAPISIVQLDLVGSKESSLNQPATQAPAADATPSPTDEAITEAVTSEETVPPGPLAAIPPSQRANHYQARPDLTIDTNKVYHATIKTNKGDIVVSLDATAAPEHVNNFIFLSKQGFYDGLTFHRVEPGFVIQGGDPEGSGQGGPGYTIPGEFSLTHIEGALAMARLPDDVNPNRESSGSQFYITLAATPFLDGQYSVFGKVEAGMDVVRSIQVGDVIERIIIEP